MIRVKYFRFLLSSPIIFELFYLHILFPVVIESSGMSPLKINNAYRGYYLVNYEEEAWMNSAAQLANESMRSQVKK